MTKPLLTHRNARYGWVPDRADINDRFNLRAPLRTIPTKVDLRETGLLPEVWDQGNLGSCTAHAIGAAFAYDLAKQGKTVIMPSRLFIYFGEREMEGTIDSDAGAMIRDGMKVIGRLGVPDEKFWPYREAEFRSRPPQEAYTDASHRQCLLYNRLLPTLKSVQDSLVRGYPVVAGFTVYESFESDTVARTGHVPVPRAGERALGGHAVTIVGYVKRGARSADLIWRNSWGPTWGEAGYFITPSSFLHACGASDFWTCEVTE